MKFKIFEGEKREMIEKEINYFLIDGNVPKVITQSESPKHLTISILYEEAAKTSKEPLKW